MNQMDRLPTSIFFVIQSFLSNREYRDLMNCNLITFQSIKRETVIYDLIRSEAPYTNEINFIEEERQENQLKLIQKVENKSKQIKMKFSKITTNKLILYSNLFQGIHQLSIYYIYREPSSDNDYKGDDSSINFNIFNNIYHVIIMYSLLPIKTIHEGLNHVTKLELKSLESLQCIENINNSKTLKELSISNCKSLTRINFPLQGMKKLEIIDCDQFTTIDGLTDGIELIVIFTMEQLSSSTLQSITTIASNLKLLSLSGVFPTDFRDFHGFRDIGCLSINTILDEENPMIPPMCYLSNFNGIRLNLRGFHFLPDPYNSNNQKNTFDFLQDLTLISCDCFLHFPVMPKLIKLTMIYVNNVQTFPTLMSLQAINLRSCPDLLSIDPFQPFLHSVEIYDAPLLTSLSFPSSSLESVEINHCPKITDVSSFKTVPMLAIRHCSGVTSLQDFAGLSLEEDERDIVLVTLPNLVSLKGLHNIHSLTLCGMEIKDKGEGIHHIHHLEITNCLVQDISGLFDIRCSLILSQCFRLTRLEKNLQNIPKVFLHNCPSLIDFSGLSGQEIVRIRDFGESQNIIEGLLPIQRQLNIQQIVIENENGEQVFRLE